ncbi:hypothetical protein L3Q82_004904 [Scortum barcoo]|uniref:Uncharacterized protein n=1 Tax=Scortum barcoo TaxID=214431 RepID=A0ACB8VDM8_9TELE|nr:hypothetical protein L3Q82_004904 [Scortum barcoo]
MFSASTVDAAVLKLWTQGVWCLLWRQPPNPVVDTGSKGCTVRLKKESYQAMLACGTPDAVDRYRQAKQAAARTVLEAKTRVWEEFGEAMEEDYQSKRFWQTVQRLRRTFNMCWSGWDENQHLQIRGHGSRPEKGGVPSPGGVREVLGQVEEFKYLGVLFMSEGKIGA